MASLAISAPISVASVTSSFIPSIHPHRASTPLPLNSASYLKAQSAESYRSVIDTIIPSSTLSTGITTSSAITSSTSGSTATLSNSASTSPSATTPSAFATSLIDMSNNASASIPSSTRNHPSVIGFGGNRGTDPDHPGPVDLNAGSRDGDDKGAHISTAHLAVLLVLLCLLTSGMLAWLLLRCWAKKRLGAGPTVEDVESFGSATLIDKHKAEQEIKETKDHDDDNGGFTTPAPRQPIDFDAAFDEREEAIKASKGSGSSPWSRRLELLKLRNQDQERDILNFVRMKEYHHKFARPQSDPVHLPSTAPATHIISKAEVRGIVTSSSMDRVAEPSLAAAATLEDDSVPQTPEQLEKHWEGKRKEMEKVTDALNRAEVTAPTSFVKVTIQDTIAEAAERMSPSTKSDIEYKWISPKRSGSEVDLVHPVNSDEPAESGTPVQSSSPARSFLGYKPMNPKKAGPNGHIPGIIRKSKTPFSSPISFMTKKKATRPPTGLPRSSLALMTSGSATATAGLGRMMMGKRRGPPKSKSVLPKRKSIDTLPRISDPFEREMVVTSSSKVIPQDGPNQIPAFNPKSQSQSVPQSEDPPAVIDFTASPIAAAISPAT